MSDFKKIFFMLIVLTAFERSFADELAMVNATSENAITDFLNIYGSDCRNEILLNAKAQNALLFGRALTQIIGTSQHGYIGDNGEGFFVQIDRTKFNLKVIFGTGNNAKTSEIVCTAPILHKSME